MKKANGSNISLYFTLGILLYFTLIFYSNILFMSAVGILARKIRLAIMTVVVES